MKAVIYIRISSTKQHTDRQYAELEQYATNKGYTIVEKYEDKISGFKDEELRPSLAKLIEDAKTDKFDIILISELSRLSRKTTKILELISYFRDTCNKSIYFQKQNIHITTSKSDLGSELQLNILATIGSYEIELSSERIQGGKIAKAKKGCWVHGVRPFGYKLNEDKTLSIYEPEAKIIREIYQLYENGYTSVRIATLFNERKYTTPSSAKFEGAKYWQPNCVSAILYSKRNIGIFETDFYEPQPKNKIPVQQRKNKVLIETVKYENKDLAIVDEDLYYSVLNRIKKNNSLKDTAKINKSLLKKLLVCGECGSNFFFKRYDKKGYKDYICYGSRFDYKLNAKRCNDTINISSMKIDGLIVAMAKEKLLMKKTFENSDEKKENVKNKIKSNEELINANENNIKELDADFTIFVKNAVKYKFSENEIDEEFKIKEGKKNNSLYEIDTLKKENRILKNRLKALETEHIGLSSDTIDNLPDDELKELLEEYIEKIVLHKTKKWLIVNVFYKNGDEEFGFLNRIPRALVSLKYDRIVKTLVSEEDYNFLEENDCLGNETYMYPYYNNSEHDLIYDRNTQTFHKDELEYSVNDFVDSLYPKNINELNAYDYFYYQNQK